jgi:hypothetical protein
MRPTVHFRLGEPRDEALLELARACPMEGTISVYAERAPDFFALHRLQGEPWLVAVAEEAGGRIVGCGSLAAREVYLDGEPVRCMYGGDVRVAEDWRGTSLVWRMHAWCWERSRELGHDLWYVSIMEGNHAARALVRPLRGQALYSLAGRAVVLGVDPLSPTKPSAIEAEEATATDLPTIAALLDRENRRCNFAPVWSTDRLARQLVTAPGLSLQDLHVVRDGGEIVGVVAAWDQRLFQRTMVVDPGRRSTWAGVAWPLPPAVRDGRPPPGAGHELRLLYLTHLAVAGDDPDVFRALLGAVRRDPRSRETHVLGLALDAAHPLLEAFTGLALPRVATEVWAGAWPGSAWAGRDFGRRPVYHEASHVY